MSDNLRVQTALVEKAAGAMLEIGYDVPPQHARALILSAAASLRENTPLIAATSEQWAHMADLTSEEFAKAFDALELLNIILVIEKGDHGLPAGVSLNPNIGWRGDDAAEHRRMVGLYPSPVLV